jgi:hypothetical protein
MLVLVPARNNKLMDGLDSEFLLGDIRGERSLVTVKGPGAIATGEGERSLVEGNLRLPG